MNILSLFDGMSCGRIALERSGVKVDKYFASEIDKYAIKVSQANYPDIIHIGDVTQVDWFGLPQIDLLIGGSPCQGFSFAGKQLNFNDPRSALFFEYVRILKELKPKYFMLENVKMQTDIRDAISEYLGVEPMLINSALLSAQNRERLYWIGKLNNNGKYESINIELPLDKHILLCDIVENHSIDVVGGAIRGRYIGNSKITKQRAEMRKDCKSNCLTTVQKDSLVFEDNQPRNLTLIECCRLQTVPENYFNGLISNLQAIKILGNGWTVDVISHIFKSMGLHNV